MIICKCPTTIRVWTHLRDLRENKSTESTLDICYVSVNEDKRITASFAERAWAFGLVLYLCWWVGCILGSSCAYCVTRSRYLSQCPRKKYAISAKKCIHTVAKQGTLCVHLKCTYGYTKRKRQVIWLLLKRTIKNLVTLNECFQNIIRLYLSKNKRSHQPGRQTTCRSFLILLNCTHNTHQNCWCGKQKIRTYLCTFRYNNFI